MDLGATVCLPRNPSCLLCPVQRPVRGAAREGAPERYPVKTRKLKRSAQSLWLLRAQTRGRLGLAGEAARRPASGPGCIACRCSTAATRWTRRCRRAARRGLQDAPPFVHVLTHKDLHLHPVRLRVDWPAGIAVPQARTGAWFGAARSGRSWACPRRSASC